MTIFWILVAGLAGLALLFVLAPLLGGADADSSRNDDVDLDAVNLDLFKQQLAELDADLAAGKLDQSQYESARQDLEREALTNIGAGKEQQPGGTALPSARLTALALLVAVPTSALVLYLTLGSQDMITRMEPGAVAQNATAQGHSGAPDGMPPLDVLVEKLEARMQQTPDDAEGWIMLGRTYFAMRNPAKAEAALARAYELTPTDTGLLLAYAEAFAANHDNSLEGRPSELIAEALKLDPTDVTARWLSGMAAFQRGQFAASVVAWKAVLAEIDPNSEDADELRQLIDNAEQRAGVPSEARLAAQAPASPSPSAASNAPSRAGQPTGVVPVVNPKASDSSAQPKEQSASDAEPTANTETAAATAAAIDVAVALSPTLSGRAAPDTTVFVYAKAAAGPPMPLAVQRIRVADLPTTLRLDDSMAMMPAMRLSSFPQVIVGARVSASGQAMPQPGDLEGETGPVPSNSADQVSITIDRIRP